MWGYVLVAALIVLHHLWAHWGDVGMSPGQKLFQWEDVNNHETVALAVLALGIGRWTSAASAR